MNNKRTNKKSDFFHSKLLAIWIIQFNLEVFESKSFIDLVKFGWSIHCFRTSGWKYQRWSMNVHIERIRLVQIRTGVVSSFHWLRLIFMLILLISPTWGMGTVASSVWIAFMCFSNDAWSGWLLYGVYIHIHSRLKWAHILSTIYAIFYALCAQSI